MTSPHYVVAALYKFVLLPDCHALREPLLDKCRALNLCGTLLLAEEGINGTIAGTAGDIDTFMDHLRADPRFHDMEFKTSHATKKPFQRMKVKVKKEIVTMGLPEVKPSENRGTYVTPEEWNTLLNDPDVVLVDTRNEYEVALGTFKGAVNPRTRSFREFPAWAESDLASREKPKVAMFCTGGIRCEKSTAYLKSLGIDDVFHLQGGILKYLEQVPEEDSLWEGECYVFDERVSVQHGLRQGTYGMCRDCGKPLKRDDKQPGELLPCPHCIDVGSQTCPTST